MEEGRRKEGKRGRGQGGKDEEERVIGNSGDESETGSEMEELVKRLEGERGLTRYAIAGESEESFVDLPDPDSLVLTLDDVDLEEEEIYSTIIKGPQPRSDASAAETPRTSSLVEGFSVEDAELLLSHGKTVAYQEGDVIIDLDVTRPEISVVKSGVVQGQVPFGNEFTVTQGKVFGMFVAMAYSITGSARLVAITNVELIVISTETLSNLFEKDVMFSLRVLNTVCKSVAGILLDEDVCVGGCLAYYRPRKVERFRQSFHLPPGEKPLWTTTAIFLAGNTAFTMGNLVFARSHLCFVSISFNVDEYVKYPYHMLQSYRHFQANVMMIELVGGGIRLYEFINEWEMQHTMRFLQKVLKMNNKRRIAGMTVGSKVEEGTSGEGPSMLAQSAFEFSVGTPQRGSADPRVTASGPVTRMRSTDSDKDDTEMHTPQQVGRIHSVEMGGDSKDKRTLPLASPIHLPVSASCETFQDLRLGRPSLVSPNSLIGVDITDSSQVPFGVNPHPVILPPRRLSTPLPFTTPLQWDSLHSFGLRREESHATFLEQGHVSKSIFLLLEGTCCVWRHQKRGGREDEVVGTVKEGQLFGIPEYFSERPATLSVSTESHAPQHVQGSAEPVVVMELDKEALDRMLEKEPQLLASLIRYFYVVTVSGLLRSRVQKSLKEEQQAAPSADRSRSEESTPKSGPRAGLARFPSSLGSIADLGNELSRKTEIAFSLLCEHDSERTSISQVKWFFQKFYGLHDVLVSNILAHITKKSNSKSDSVSLDDFKSLTLMPNVSKQPWFLAVSQRLAIVYFKEFTEDLNRMYENSLHVSDGNVHPTFAMSREDMDSFGVSVCTVSGQVWNRGDYKERFTAQSISKVFTFCATAEAAGTEVLDQHVGSDPQGSATDFDTDSRNRPFNPLVTSGGLVTTSLYHPEANTSDRYNMMLYMLKRMCGAPSCQTQLGFDNVAYLRELANAEKQYALAYMLKDMGCFPDVVRSRIEITETLRLYFMICSILINCKDAAVMAATLANNGVNPITGDRILSERTTRKCLTLMFSSGMNTFSGEFGYRIGLPSKSGISGAVLLVVPGKMGIAIYSPRIDQNDNSVRALHFCSQFVAKYTFHIFDDVAAAVEDAEKINPCGLRISNSTEVNGLKLIFAAANGHLKQVQQLVSQGVPVNFRDRYGRTPLHVAIAEKRGNVVRWLLERKADVYAVDIEGRGVRFDMYT